MRWRARAAGAVAAVLVGVVLAAPPSSAAPHAPAQVTEPTLRLLSQPVAVAPDGEFTVLLAVEGAPDATEIAVDLYDRVGPGDPIGPEPAADPEVTFGPQALGAPGLDGRRTTGFTIHLSAGTAPDDPVWGQRLDEPGVYPVRVRLRGGEGPHPILMTSLIRLPGPDQSVPRTDAALLVPVHRPPPADPDQRATADTADAELLDQLTPILAELNARPTLPASFSITPDTLARIVGDPDAASELTQLRAALEDDQRVLLDAPYVDIAPASLVDAGLDDLLALERDFGRQTLRDLLEPPTAGTWELGTRVDADALAAMRSRGIFRAVLPADDLSGEAGTFAPVELGAGSGSVRAVALSPDYALGTQAPDDPVLAAHRLLARLSAAGEEGDGDGSAVVVALDPATVDPVSLQILGDALAFGSPFLRATTVDRLLDARPRQVATTTPPAPVALGTYPARVQQSLRSLDSYAAMVGGRSELVRPYQLTLAVSAADDLDLGQRQQDASSVSAALQGPFTSVSIPAKDKVTLGARNATFPLPITSELDYPVKVVIELEANDRIEFPRNRQQATLTKGRQVISIPVRTRTAGDTPVRIVVRSPDDDGVVLAEGTYTIRSTAVSGVGVVLTVAAAAFLVVWWARHWHRSRGAARHAKRRGRARHRPDPTDDPGGDPSEANADEHDDDHPAAPPV